MEKTNKYSFKDEYVFRMTDDTGIFQHSKYSVPDPRKGYTTDDNARALIMVVMLYEKYRDKKYKDLIFRYMSFLLNAINKNGMFKNFMNYDRRFSEEQGSEDCFGRCIWALCFTLSKKIVPSSVRDVCRYLLKESVQNCSGIVSPRSRAYCLAGLCYIKQPFIKDIRKHLADSLVKDFDQNESADWHWFEDIIAYSNAVLPWALFKYYRLSNCKESFEVAKKSLDFLEKITFRKGYFKPVGCKGWMLKGKEPAEYDEQPLEACETIMAYIEALKVTEEKKFAEKAWICFKWYYGLNSENMSMIDSQSGGCYDGITENGVNLNQGAESLISHSIAYLSIMSLNKFSA